DTAALGAVSGQNQSLGPRWKLPFGRRLFFLKRTPRSSGFAFAAERFFAEHAHNPWNVAGIGWVARADCQSTDLRTGTPSSRPLLRRRP
ncbi:MAG: hypothetical protein WBP72_15645, partial [Rhodocyclaceae bacterium]